MSASITIEQRIGAPPTVVWSYLTRSDHWTRWQGVAATIDARPGGLFTMSMPGGQRARGQFVDLVPHRRVVFTWGWIDHDGIPPGATTVEIELRPDGDGTLLVLTHHGVPHEELPIHTAGWRHYLPRLAAAAEGRDLGADLGPS